MIAPAWPIRRPGGAVRPAMNATTGFFTFFFTNAAAASSSVPPISPIRMIPSVSASLREQIQQFDEIQPLDRIAADADAGRLPDPARAALPDRFVRQRSAAADDPHLLPALGFPPACEYTPA